MGVRRRSPFGDWRRMIKKVRLKMMPIESLLFSSPVDEQNEQHRCDRPVADGPLEQRLEFPKQLRGEFPDFLHVTTSGKSDSRTSE
jgi:hypothetical protein